MFKLLLSLVFLARLSAGVPVDEVQCPRIHCPVIMCEAPEPTYFQYEGQTCQGCSLCSAIDDQAEVQCPTKIHCPVIMCEAPELTYIQFEGKMCPGCRLCPATDQEEVQCPRMHCPVIMCEAPEPTYFQYQGQTCPGCRVCPATYQEEVQCPQIHCPMITCEAPAEPNYFQYEGLTCQGCSLCPATDDQSEVQCPTRIHCPVIMCEAPEPTSFQYEGKTCPGCSRCPATDQEKRQLLLCPVVDCLFIPACSQPLQPGVLHVGGQECPGCSYCPDDSATLPTEGPVEEQKRQRLTPCPLINCLDPYPCSVPLQQTFLYIGDAICRGCPFCPDEVEKRQLVVNPCPQVMCVNPYPCPVPLERSIIHMGSTECPGCLFCPVNSTAVDEQKKRQLLLRPDPFICPLVMCLDVFLECSVPVQQSIYTVGGRQCPGCPVCPVVNLEQSTTVSTVQKRLLIDFCPHYVCLDLEIECSVPLQRRSFLIEGKMCYGCPYCPANTSTEAVQRRQLVVLDLCPMVMCAEPGPCSVPLQLSTMKVNGKECPGCPYCPEGSSVDTVQKRQAVSARVCPVVDCIYLAPCAVPMEQTTILIDGMECPGCLLCRVPGDPFS